MPYRHLFNLWPVFTMLYPLQGFIGSRSLRIVEKVIVFAAGRGAGNVRSE